MNGGAWWATVHGVAKTQTRPSDSHIHFTFQSVPLNPILMSLRVATRQLEPSPQLALCYEPHGC